MDLSPQQPKQEVDQRSKFTIRTSDRRVFRRCLRKWDFSSSMRQNLTHEGVEQNLNFWFGSAIHFALEDYHGYNRFKDPRRAFYAYYHAFKEDELPAGADVAYSLGIAMLSYYITWFEKHNEFTGFQTIWFDEQNNVVLPFTEGAHPAVEQPFYIDLGINVVVDVKTDEIYGIHKEDTQLEGVSTYPGMLIQKDGKYYLVNGVTAREVRIVPIYYHGTMDKLMIDKYGRWWINDYKTAKGADINKLDTDDQISAYMWAAELWFQHPIYGFVYHQLTKDRVQDPKRLKNGELSVDKKQKTTYSLLRKEIIDDYGEVNKAPSKLIQFLNDLAAKETPEGDRFIRWDFVTRDANQVQSTYENIMAEVMLMLSPDLKCFPNPTRDCIWDCPFRDICIATDRKDEDEIKQLMTPYVKRPRSEDGNIDEWRNNIKWPESEEDLIPMDVVLAETAAIHIELDATTEDSSEFQFLYEEDC